MPPISAVQTYTISEAAALTGLHKNTIRQRIRLGQLEAVVQQGKFGEEYRIERPALVRAGLLEDARPTDGPLPDESVPEPTAPPGSARPADGAEEREAPHAEALGVAEPVPGGAEASSRATVAALSELYQRHEQAMFRLGYMQGELERAKALAENAESLRQGSESREQELQTLRAALVEREHEAGEADRLRRELERAQERLRELEQIRQDLESLKCLAEQQAAARKRSWWRFRG